MVKEMDNNKHIFLEKFFVIQNIYFEEQNYIEILKGYCENKLEVSEDLSIIYPVLTNIYELHIKAAKESEHLVLGI